MRRALLTLVLLTPPAQAAPQLKPKPPARSGEDARIEKLRAKYDRMLDSDHRAVSRMVGIGRARVRAMIQMLDKLALEPPSEENTRTRKAVLEEIEGDPMCKDLYDIAMYDRRKAADE